MSNNGDLKQEGPPTLFKSESETDEAGHTRILASLEGRVSANGKAPKKSGRRYGVAAAIAVLVAGVGAWVLLNPTGESAPAQVAEQAAPAAAQSAAAQVDTAAAPLVASAPVVAVASEPAADMQPATIVNVTPSDEHAIDKLGKAPHAETTVSHAAAAKSANTDEGKTATAKLVAKSTDTPFKPLQATKTKAQSPAKSARNRKGTLAPDDPDADLLAALLAPQNAANKVINPPNSKGQ